MKKFDDAFRTELKAAVQAVEEKSGVELVVALVPRVERYWAVHLLVGAVVSLTLLTVLMFMPAEVWFVKIYYETLLAFGLGLLLPAAFAPLKRLLLGKKYLQRRAEERARAAFYQAGIYLTSHRTGVLVFVAFFERQVVVLADVVAEESVPPQEWEVIRLRFAEAFTAQDPAQAVLTAIADSRDAFSVFIPRSENDVNELPDELWHH